jgi:hypothetical protein
METSDTIIMVDAIVGGNEINPHWTASFFGSTYDFTLVSHPHLIPQLAHLRQRVGGFYISGHGDPLDNCSMTVKLFVDIYKNELSVATLTSYFDWGDNFFLEEFDGSSDNIRIVIGLEEVSVCLSYDTHSREPNMPYAYDNPEMSDCSITFGEPAEAIHVSRFLLALSSEYFKGLLMGNFKESQQTESIEILEVDPVYADMCLRWLYHQDVIVTARTPNHLLQRILDFYFVARRLLIDSLCAELLATLETFVVCLENFGHLYHVAIAIDSKRLKRRVGAFWKKESNRCKVSGEACVLLQGLGEKDMLELLQYVT